MRSAWKDVGAALWYVAAWVVVVLGAGFAAMVLSGVLEGTKA